MPGHTGTRHRGWPEALQVEAETGLSLDGCDLGALARERGTPLWAISRSTVEANYRSLDSAFRARWPRFEIAYSMKTNDSLAVVRLMHGLGARLDCSGAYELQAALQAGVPASDAIVNGAGKSDDDVEMAVDGAEVAWNGSVAGGVTDVNRSTTRYANCRVHDNLGAAFAFEGGSHRVTDTVIYNQARDFSVAEGTKFSSARIDFRR